MSTQTAIPFQPPVGRLVQGDLYKPQTKDQQGNPLVIKTGPNKGQATQKYFFALAVPKTPGAQHWSQEPWGDPIWRYGHAAWPTGQATSPSFAWKIEDGDSVIPNKMGRKNCDREGFPGNWIINFSSSFPSKVFTSTGDPIVEPGAVKLGYYVVVAGSVDSNENPTNPGIYMNHNMVGLAGYGAEIRQGPDPKAVFKGGYALPPGASATPVGGALPATPPAAPVPGAPPAYVPPPAPAPALPPQTAVQPAPSFLAPPPPPGVPAPPPAAVAPPPPPAGPVLTAKAPPGTTYPQFIAAGWTDATLRAAGYL